MNIIDSIKKLAISYVSEGIAIAFDHNYYTDTEALIAYFKNTPNSRLNLSTYFSIIVKNGDFNRIGATYILTHYFPELNESFSKMLNRAYINGIFDENTFNNIILEKYEKLSYFKTIKQSLYDRYFGTSFYRSETKKFFNTIKISINEYLKNENIQNNIDRVKFDFYTITSIKFYFKFDLLPKYMISIQKMLLEKFNLIDDYYSYLCSPNNDGIKTFIISIPTNNFAVINSDEIKQYIKI